MESIKEKRNLLYRNTHGFLMVFSAIFIILIFSNCSEDEEGIDDENETEIVIDDTEFTTDDWTEGTHSKSGRSGF